MVICTIYSHDTGFDKIVDSIKSIFPKGTLTTKTEEENQVVEVETKSGLFRSSQKLKITYRQRQVFTNELPEGDASPIALNIRGLYGYVQTLPARNPKIKDLLLQKIASLNAEFSIIREGGNDKTLRDLIAKLAAGFDAILFVQPGTPISRAAGQHFLDKNLDLLLDTAGNSEVENLGINVDSTHLDTPAFEITEDQQERKVKSERILTKRSIRINAHLPLIESEKETVIRSPREIAERLCLLSMTTAVAFDNLATDEAVAYLEQHGIWDLATPNEKDFFKNLDQKKKTRESWKCEDIYVLLWALNKVPDLGFPDGPVSMDQMDPKLCPVGPDKNPKDFIDAATETRSKAEILDAADLYYRLDWACVDARLKNQKIEGLHPAVVYERHYALNWLINYCGQEWDDISCDT